MSATLLCSIGIYTLPSQAKRIASRQNNFQILLDCSFMTFLYCLQTKPRAKVKGE